MGTFRVTEMDRMWTVGWRESMSDAHSKEGSGGQKIASLCDRAAQAHRSCPPATGGLSQQRSEGFHVCNAGFQSYFHPIPPCSVHSPLFVETAMLISSWCRNYVKYFHFYSWLQFRTALSLRRNVEFWLLLISGWLFGGWGLNKFSWWGAQDTVFWKQNVSHRSTDVLCWRCGNFNGADLLKDVTGFKSCSSLVLSLLYFVYRERTSLICRLHSTSPELMQPRTTNRNLSVK